MDIQFRCSNISHFDKATGQYQPCGQKMEASEAHVGLKVRCPKCKQQAVVPSPAMVGSGSAEISDTPEPDGGLFGQPVESAPETSGLTYSQFDKKTRCRKCGSLLDGEGRCTACYFVAPAMKPASTPIDQIAIQPAGFQLWFQQIMADGVGMFQTAAHSLFAVTMLLCLLAAIGLGGGTAFAWVVIGVVVLTLMYVIFTLQMKRLSRVPAARLPFYLRPFWYGVLVFARINNWQRYDSRLSGRVVIDVRGQPFSDRDLLELEHLPICQVIDADGTDLTDAGLALMHGLKNLRCLVIRRTHVTREGVYRLQQAIPRCWIWY